MTEWMEMWPRWEVWIQAEDELGLGSANSEQMTGVTRTRVQLPRGAGVREPRSSRASPSPGGRERPPVLSRASRGCSRGV